MYIYISGVKVGYATALDVFIIICFMSVFTALIEFAFINFLDMFIRRLKHRSETRVGVRVSFCKIIL